MDERALADKLIGTYHTNDPFELCRMMDFLVLRLPLPARVHGFYQLALGSRILYLNDALPAEQESFVCAHELGHALMHGQDNRIFLDSATYLVSAKLEHAADRFAGYLLVPDDAVLLSFPGEPAVQIAQQLGLPVRVVEDRLYRLVEKGGASGACGRSARKRGRPL